MHPMQRLCALIAMMALAIGAPAGAAPPKPAPNWAATITRSADEGYVLGNPAAPLKLVAYVSFTCPHCADFEAESDAQLRLGMIAPGKGSYEMRPFLRNVVDVAASLLAECGPPARFFGNAQLLFATQQQWVAPAANLTSAQKARWQSPDFATRMRAIAGDLGLYAIMERRGYDRVTLDRCLADKALADRLAKHTEEAGKRDFVTGTPTFLIDGVPLAGTYSWEVLRPQIEARLH